jgi:hypothetical protein
LIDASGSYGSPNWAGSGGIPARGELYLAPQMSYRCDDVAGLKRERHAGRRTLVIGGGASAVTTVAALAALAESAPGTSVAWAMREARGGLVAEQDGDPLPRRAALHRTGRELLAGGNAAVTGITGVEVDGFEYNTGTHRYRVALTGEGGTRVEEVDEVVINAGFGPDDSLHRELQVDASFTTRGPAKLAAALAGASGDCLEAPAPRAAALANPEPDFWILGAKSYGRRGSAFLLADGYAQVAEVLA